MTKRTPTLLSRPVDRRTVLKGMALGGAATLVGSASAINEILPSYGSEQVLTTGDNEGLLRVFVKNGMILRVESLDAPNITAAPQALAWDRRAYAPDRILYPMVRTDWAPGGGGDRTTRGKPSYKRVSWDEALGLVADELTRVKDGFGNEAILAQVIAGWSTLGNFHSKNAQVGRFFGLYGGNTKLLGNKSYACWQWAAPYSIGMVTPQMAIQESLDNANLVIFWGGDPFNTTRTAWGNGLHQRWIKDLHRKGTKLVTIDPVFTETAASSQDWIPIRPGADAAVMAAMAYVMLSEGLQDQAFLDKYVIGFEPFRQYVTGESDGTPKTPAWAAALSDLSEERITALAREFATTKNALLVPGYGLQRQDHGEQQVRMIIALAAMKGELGVPGGGLAIYVYGMHGLPTANAKSFAGFPGATNPVTQTILEQRFADSILNAPVVSEHDGTSYTYPEDGKSELKLIHWVGGSGVNQHDHIDLTLQALQKIETIIVQDSWWTAGARLADIVLPITTLFERNDLSTTWRYALYQHQIIEPLGEARSDFEVFRELADRLGFKADFTQGRDTEDDWLRFLYASANLPLTYEQFREQGVVEFDLVGQPTNAFAAFRADPALNPLGTPSGKIEIHSDKIASYGYAECPGTPQWLEPAEWLGNATEAYPLHLITKHPWWRRHSSYDNVDTLHKDSKINGFEPVLINPQDASARGIATGDMVRVFNGRGQTVCAAHVTADVRPGVVIVQEGSWFRPEEPGTVGSIDRGGCANMLTRQEGTSRLAQGPVAHSNLVQVEAFEAVQPNDYAPITSV